jgi:antitoxin (DNA-binding transcriptional repressor) of toxin-antitoxin stability system
MCPYTTFDINSGEDVVICKAGRPIVRLIKYNNLSTPRKSGAWKGKVKIAEDFDQLLPQFTNPR